MSPRRWRIWRAVLRGQVDHMTKISPPGDMQTPDFEEQAAEMHTRRRGASWSEADQRVLDSRLAESPEFADAYGRAQDSWDAVGRYANSPDLAWLCANRRLRAHARRVLAAGPRLLRAHGGPARGRPRAALLVVCGVTWQRLAVRLRTQHLQNRAGRTESRGSARPLSHCARCANTAARAVHAGCAHR